jgi:hypothetical protein
VFLLLLAIFTIAMYRSEPKEYRTFEHTCGKCGYDRTGIARDAVCPECGSPVLPPQATGTRLRLRPHARPVAYFSWGMLGLYYLLGPALALRVVALSYRVMGYSWGTSLLAAKHREFAYGADNTDLYLFPLGIAIGLSPLLQRLEPGRKRQFRMALIVLAGLLGCIAIWTLPYARWPW